MNQTEMSLDLLLQETLAMSEYLRVANSSTVESKNGPASFFDAIEEDDDYLYDLADNMIADEPLAIESKEELSTQVNCLPMTSGIIYKIDNASSTFCVRGFCTPNIKESFIELTKPESSKRVILKIADEENLETIAFFETKNIELAEAIRDQVINRRFPHQEDALCNLSDPGFSWWMNIEPQNPSKFEIFFRSHGINRADKYIQLGPIGDGSVAALRMNQARTLLRSSFPISEFSCDDKSFTVASLKPDHLSFVSFKNIFLEGVNHTELENFPDNSVGRTLYYYFHELAVVRKFWIEVKSKLG